MTLRIDLGCGNKPKSGYIGIDIRKEYNPDICYDLDEGLMFKKEAISAIWMDNSLEHFKDPFYILEHCYRILRSGGIIEIIIPNCQWFPLLILGWFTDIHRFWNWWMTRKVNRGIHYSLWSPYTLKMHLTRFGFMILEEKGHHLSKEYYVKAIK